MLHESPWARPRSLLKLLMLPFPSAHIFFININILPDFPGYIFQEWCKRGTCLQGNTPSSLLCYCDLIDLEPGLLYNRKYSFHSSCKFLWHTGYYLFHFNIYKHCRTRPFRSALILCILLFFKSFMIISFKVWTAFSFFNEKYNIFLKTIIFYNY